MKPSSPHALGGHLSSLVPEGRVLSLDFRIADLQMRHDYDQALEILSLQLLEQMSNARVGVVNAPPPPFTISLIISHYRM